MDNGNNDFIPHIVVVRCDDAPEFTAGVNTCADGKTVKVSSAHVPCVYTMSPKNILDALRQGVDGICIVPCGAEECGADADIQSKRHTFKLFCSMLEYVGIEAERLYVAQPFLTEQGFAAFVHAIYALGANTRLVKARRQQTKEQGL